MMMYKFTRTPSTTLRTGGNRPVEECAGADVIRDCFAPCSATVKARLDKFLDEGQEEITFEFILSTVTVRRVKNCREG